MGMDCRFPQPTTTQGSDGFGGKLSTNFSTQPTLDPPSSNTNHTEGLVPPCNMIFSDITNTQTLVEAMHSPLTVQDVQHLINMPVEHEEPNMEMSMMPDLFQVQPQLTLQDSLATATMTMPPHVQYFPQGQIHYVYMFIRHLIHLLKTISLVTDTMIKVNKRLVQYKPESRWISMLLLPNSRLSLLVQLYKTPLDVEFRRIRIVRNQEIVHVQKYEKK